PPKPVRARILTSRSKAELRCSLLMGIFGRGLTIPGSDPAVSVWSSSTDCPLADAVDAGFVETVVANCSCFSAELPVAVVIVMGNADSTGACNLSWSFLLKSECSARPLLGPGEIG